MNIFVDAEWADEPVSLHLAAFDEGDESIVYRATFNDEHVVFFEATPDVPFWSLVFVAVQCLNEELDWLG
jgi:hypothetical protein